MYKLKGVTGILESMALADYSGIPLEMENIYGLLADLVREIYKDLEPLMQILNDRKAVIITSEGEVEAAKNMAIAAQTLASSPGAMQLRTLSTLADLGTSPSNNTVWVVPTDLVNNLSQISANLSGRPTNIGRMN